MQGKGSGIFQKWFTNFAMAVFTQSLHAVMLTFLLLALSELQKFVKNDPGSFGTYDIAPLMSFITFFAVTGITRAEKAIKDLFGIKDSEFLKGAKENTAKTMFAVKSAINMGKNVTSAISEGKEAIQKKRNLAAQMKKYEGEGKVQKGRGGYYGVTYGEAKTQGGGTVNESFDENNANGDTAAYTAASAAASVDKMGDAFKEVENAAKSARTSVTTANNSGGSATRTTSPQGTDVPGPTPTAPTQGGATTKASGDGEYQPGNDYERLKYENEKNKAKDREENEREKIQKKVDEYNAANRSARKMIADTIFNTGSTIAGLGVASGLDNDLQDIVNIGNVISQPFVEKSTDLLVRNANKKIQEVAYEVAKKTGGVEAVLNVKISPEFQNGPTIVSTVSDALTPGNRKDVDVSSASTVRKVVENVKRTGHKALKSTNKLLRTNANRDDYINSVDDI